MEGSVRYLDIVSNVSSQFLIATRSTLSTMLHVSNSKNVDTNVQIGSHSNSTRQAKQILERLLVVSILRTLSTMLGLCMHLCTTGMLFLIRLCLPVVSHSMNCTLLVNTISGIYRFIAFVV